MTASQPPENTGIPPASTAVPWAGKDCPASANGWPGSSISRALHRLERIGSWRGWAPVGLLLILGWALYIRLHQLDVFFPGLYKDEADTGDEALFFFHAYKLSDLFTVGTWGGVSRFQWFLTAGFLKLAGANAYGLRLFNVVLSLVGLPIVYGIARKMRMRPFAALIAVFLLATLHWTLSESRMGWPNPIVLLTVPVEVLLAILAMNAGKEWRIGRWVALGLWTVFMLWGFIGAHPVFVAIALWGIWLMATAGLLPWLWRRARPGQAPAEPMPPGDIATGAWRFHPRILLGAALTLSICVAGLLPWVPYYRANPLMLNLRARQTCIYCPGLDVRPEACATDYMNDPAKHPHWPEAYCKWRAAHPNLPSDPLTILKTNIPLALGMFTKTGESDDAAFNICGQPQLSRLTGILFLAALGWMLLRGALTLAMPRLRPWRRPTDSLLLLWMGAFLLFAEALTMPMPKASHGLPLVPALCLIIGQGASDAFAGAAWVRRRGLTALAPLSPHGMVAGRNVIRQALLPLFCAGCLVVLGVVARQEWHWYFTDYYNNHDTYTSFDARAYEMGLFAAHLPGAAPVVLVYAADPYPADVTDFVQGKGRLQPVMCMQDNAPKLDESRMVANPAGLIFTGDPAILAPYEAQWKRQCPNLAYVDHKDRFGQLLFTSAVLPP